LDDRIGVTEVLISDSARFGIDPDWIAVGGSSDGAGLASAIAWR